MIPRDVDRLIQQYKGTGKILVLMGGRQVGKTTLLKKIFANALWLNGDEADTRENLVKANEATLRNELGSNKIVVIDEAQRIENIGLIAKIIADKIPDIELVLSGSSSFDLANKINEPLTGRKWELMLFPLSVQEMINYHGQVTENRLLEKRIIYGYYPEVVMKEGMQQALLKSLSSDYLYKDILTWETIKKPDKLERLVQAIAFQIGQLVSYNELSKMCGINVATVERYVNLLEQTFIIYRLGSFSRNIRNELNKSRKIYFNDTGLRNATINQFQPISLRNDIGGLWENYLISERAKFLSNNQIYCNRYFWRTKDQAEIDYIEEMNGEIHAYEFKWNPAAKASFPKSFMEAYKPGSTTIIHRDNYMEWLKNQ
jgi:uncharacterized protein